ncbi:MAG TPA: arginine deiminase family protein [Pyrinomonadaceae bacterium]|nr:arginine deiminase family protein [Pyrinomonadaceae bacterium]
MFSKAIVRPPGANFAAGLTTVDLGVPDLERALKQHEAYCQTLESCGLKLIRLAPDEALPDSTFVEDTAILTSRGAVITRPGAPSRLHETRQIGPLIQEYFATVHSIENPGAVDGGDICEAGDHFFIGVSRRTNEHGAEQLARHLDSFGYSSSLIDIRGVSNILHLKSGLAWLGGQQLVLIEALRGFKEFSGYDVICLDGSEDYAANCLEINGKVLIAGGFPSASRELEHRGYQTIALDMSEFQKMDGGLSCLSLRF